MQQNQKTFESPEKWGTNVAMDLVTHGMFDFMNSMKKLVTKIYASMSLVFLRSKVGSEFFTVGTLAFGWVIFLITWMIEQAIRVDWVLATGNDVSGNNSTWLILLHMFAFAIVGAWRVWHATRNLRRVNGKVRFSNEPGYSLLWPFFRRILLPTGIIAKEGQNLQWWQLNELQFQKKMEPLLVFALAWIAWSFSYPAYATLLGISAVCCLLLILEEEELFFKQKQKNWDMQILSNVMQNVDQPVERGAGMLVRQNLARSHQAWESYKKSA